MIRLSVSALSEVVCTMAQRTFAAQQLSVALVVADVVAAPARQVPAAFARQFETADAVVTASLAGSLAPHSRTR